MEVSNFGPETLIFLLLLCIQLTKSQKPCEEDEAPCCLNSKSRKPCSPCERSLWYDMLFKNYQPFEVEQLANGEYTCYNNDPLFVPRKHRQSDYEEVTIAVGKTDLDPITSLVGFSIPQDPFWRFPLDDMDTIALPSGDKIDIGNVQIYYKRTGTGTGTGKENDFDSDFEFLEWPGLNIDGRRDALEVATEIRLDSLEDRKLQEIHCFEEDLSIPQCQHSIADMRNKTLVGKPCNNVTCSGCRTFFSRSEITIYEGCVAKRQDFRLLVFAKKFAKFRYYPCNNVEGTSISAMGLLAEVGDRFIYLSSGEDSVDRDYIHPLLVPLEILYEMGQNEALDNRGDDCITVRPPPNNATEDDEDVLNGMQTVYDFEFTRNRLILGMKCGILIVKDILSENIVMQPSKLWSSKDKQGKFPLPIHTIASSACCHSTHECKTVATIIAAYPMEQKGTVKVLYVSHDLGDTFETSVIGDPLTPLNLINGIFNVYNNLVHPKPKILPSAPKWVSEFTDQRFEERFKGKYTPTEIKSKEDCIHHTDCKDKQLEDDPVVKFLLDTEIKTPKPDSNSEPFCDEIVSMEVEQEQFGLTVLCRIGAGDRNATPTAPPPGATLSIEQFYAVYSIHLRRNNPVIVPVRKSKRIFRCQAVNDVGRDPIPPELIRVQGSSNYIIVNCKNVIYYSTNGCRTLYNAVFYFKDPIPFVGPPPTPPPAPATENRFVRDYFLQASGGVVNFELDGAPLAAVDPEGNYIALTYKDYYILGAISYNREFRFVSGILSKTSGTSNPKTGNLTYYVPWYTNSGRLTFLAPLKLRYNTQPTYRDMYSKRYALRLVEYPSTYYFDLKPFFDENRNIESEQPRLMKHIFSDCQTYGFSVTPTKASLDLGETATFIVRVGDENPHLSLTIFSSQDKSISVSAKFLSTLNESRSNRNTHKWAVTVSSIPTYKSTEEILVDAFFGTSYDSLNAFSTNLALLNAPSIRCHVQPSAIVEVNIGCQHKVLIAYEEEHRPQCDGEFYNFQYTLKTGEYDHEMVDYWMKKSENTAAGRSSPVNKFFEKKPEGMQITYDYATFGCPLQPYRLDYFAPDLRIVDTQVGVSASSPKYNGEYILIEIFGAKGYSFKLPVQEAKCHRAPQTLEKMTEIWKARRNAFKEISKQNILFDIESVILQENIWNRANYESCRGDQFIGSTDKKTVHPIIDSDSDAYQIMKGTKVSSYNGEHVDKGDVEDDDVEENPSEKEDNSDEDNPFYNEIVWNPKEHQQVYIFLAIAVDPYTSFCEFKTIFGVSLPPRHATKELVSIIIYILFVLLWIFIVILGYVGRRAYIRNYFLREARIERLEEAAWTIIYRYERIIHEQTIKRKKKVRKLGTNTSKEKMEHPS